MLLATGILVAWGLVAASRTPVDAIPDLSDVQVIVRTTFPGQAPQVVEDQVTYPLTTTLLSVPHAKTVRGYSLFGESFVYVLFDDGTDLYWARSRVLEYLSQVQARLPEGATAALGPDATGVGWVYEYALVDRSGTHDISELRALQDWFLKFELKTVPNVAEVATIGGFNRQYQIVVDPGRLRAFSHSVGDGDRRGAHGKRRDRRLGARAGGSRIHGARARLPAFTRRLPRHRCGRRAPTAPPSRLGDVATVQLGPEIRRGVADLDGEGEVVGGVIVLRSGANARAAIEAVKTKLQALQAGLPDGVEDRARRTTALR